MTANFKTYDACDDDLKPSLKHKYFKQKYPWHTMEERKSFGIDINVNPVKIQTMQSAASRMGKKLNRKFRAVQKGEWIVVTRLPDKEDANQESNKEVIK